jgi:lactose/L-arabinose transport system permease protein
MMMALVIATLPMMVIFLLMQRQFVEGILGSIKQ